MKILKIKNIRIIAKTQNDYTIKTPNGTYKDINKAIKQYPYLREHKNIRQCPMCKQYFLSYSRAWRKYCSDGCAETYNIINKREISRMWMRDKYLRDKNKTLLNDIRNREQNTEFHQDDRFWGLGESGLKEHRNNDFMKEAQLIQNELYRIRNKKYNWRENLY